MVTIQVALHTNPRGPGFWKLNTSFLSETEYINQIKTTIEGVKGEYQNDKSVNASLLWAYKKLVSTKKSCPTKSQEKWSADCSLQCSKTIDWEMAYKLPFSCTKATKLIIFQFKLLHRRLATNDFLHKIGIREDDICTFCRTEKESLFHLFWSCSETSCFWQGFMKWLAENQIKLKSEIFTPDIIIGLRSDTLSNTKQYFYFLVARYYIWSCRIKEVLPKIERFPSFLSSLKPF